MTYKTIDIEMRELLAVLSRVAPANIAPIPLSLWFEDGHWTCEAHVRIKGVTEYEVAGTGVTLPDALTNTRRALAHEEQNIRQSRNDASIFGLTF